VRAVLLPPGGSGAVATDAAWQGNGCDLVALSQSRRRVALRKKVAAEQRDVSGQAITWESSRWEMLN
jgi:hypothetical protein